MDDTAKKCWIGIEKMMPQISEEMNMTALTAADWGGSDAAAMEQAQRTVGDGGGNVTPTAARDHEADEEKDNGSEAGSEADKDFDEG